MAQFDIGTTNPQATLDVNGTLKINTTIQETEIDVIKDSILVISRTGMVNRVPAEQIVKAALPTTVKAYFSSGGTKTLAITLGSFKITFDIEEVDSNDEFDVTTSTYTAKQDGIYSINAQIKISSGISVSTNFGIRIEKNGVVIAEENYLSVVVTTTNVSSHYRRISTTIDLAKDDTITF
jgi:hypothetical protein